MRVAFMIVMGLAALAWADTNAVPVKGSEVTYVRKVQQMAHGKPVDLTITGTALRTKYTFNIYALASYVQDGVPVAKPEELATVDAVKLLHLVMERKVSGPDFIDAFKTAVGKDKAKNEFATQFKKLEETLKDATADTGEYVLLTYIPKAGTRFRVADRIDTTIEGAEFGQALWGTFFGPRPVDAAMKTGLFSQMGK